MKNKIKKFYAFLLVGFLIPAVLTGCATQAYALGEKRLQEQNNAENISIAAQSSPAGSQAAQSTVANTSQSSTNPSTTATPSVTFRLETGMASGKMVFISRDQGTDGSPNPNLQVKVGDVVEIILINGDSVQHNITVPDMKAQSSDVLQKGEETHIVFTADKEGVFPYFCNIPGHRQAGMEGKLIVGNPTAQQNADYPSISRSPDDLPGPINRSTPATVQVNLETVEVEGKLADGTGYHYWTFNGKVPGPFLRVRVGDTVEVSLKNADDSTMIHSVDFHAVTGPGGGAVATQTNPGEETHFTFKALNPGLFVYHCATPMVANHIANGMYGLILVEPEGGLPPVDHEYYVMQGEIYTAEPLNHKGETTFSLEKLMDESPEYMVFNGSVGALTSEHPLQAKVGDTVRIYFGDGGPNKTSSFHVIGEIFDRVYDHASLTSAPLTDVQTTIVPTGGATVVEFTIQVPGRYILVDHSLSRMERGLAGYLVAEGPDAPEIFSGEMTPGSGH